MREIPEHVAMGGTNREAMSSLASGLPRLCYADGHAGNVGMRDLAASASAYDASILEIVGSDATVEDVCQREMLWKTKLGSRAKGLNRN